MGRSIAFTDVDVSNVGVVTCAVRRDGEAQELWFRLPYAFTPASDLLAAVFAGLCGAVFDEVRMDLPIGPKLSAAIGGMTGARVEPAPGADRGREPGTGAVFADGLAALDALRLLGPGAASLLDDDTGIPGPVLERIPATSLAFMERFDPPAYAGLPPELLGDWHARLLRFGVPPYERQDWFDAATAMKAVRNRL